MIRSILVTLDDSESSESAKTLSIAFAKHYKATLAGIGVLDEPWISAPEAIPLGGAAFKVQFDEKLLQDARRQVHRLEKQFIEECKAEKISCTIIDAIGVPSYEIEYFATEYDVLIIGKDASFHFNPSQETGVAVTQILKDNPRPMIVTGPHLPNQESPHVLVGFDGAFASSRALQMALLMGMFEGKTVHLVSVSSDEEEAQNRVNAAYKFCQNHGMKAHLHPTVTSQRPATALLELSEDLKPSLIVMGAFGHGGLRSFFMGSCTKNLLKSTSIPLFIYH